MGDDKVKSEAMQIIGMFQILPKLVVFDLDYTLWPFYCECRSKREMPSLYPHAKGILYALKDKGIDLAIASRSPTPDIATTFLTNSTSTPSFPPRKCFPVGHIKQNIFRRSIQELVCHSTQCSSSTMRTGILTRHEQVSKRGVTSIIVGNGVSLGALREGLTKFSQNTNTVEKNKQRWTKFSEKANSSKKKKQDDD